jgi:hypothetical protein
MAKRSSNPDQLNFDHALAAQIAGSVEVPTGIDQGGITETPASTQFNLLEMKVREGDMTFDMARAIAALRNTDARKRLYARLLIAGELPDPDLVEPKIVQPQTYAGKLRYKSRHERRPKYYDKDNNIRNNRLSSKEKGRADYPTEPV